MADGAAGTRADRVVSRLVLAVLVPLVLYYAWRGGVLLVDWIREWPAYGPIWWSNLLAWAWENASILVVIYTIVSINAAGVVEFRHGKPFIKALVLALALTPPVMVAVWGRRPAPAPEPGSGPGEAGQSPAT